MTARKARKSGTRSKSGRGRAAQAFDRLQQELPPTLAGYVKQVGGRLDRLEQQIQNARDETRRRWTRLLRDASRELGKLEVRGEREWEKRSLKLRRDAVALLKRLEKAIEPPQARTTRKKSGATRKKSASKKSSSRKKTGRKKTGRKKTGGRTKKKAS